MSAETATAPKERFWPDLTPYGLSLWIERLPQEPDGAPPQYRFRLLAQQDLTPEQVYMAKEPFAELGRIIDAKTGEGTRRGDVRMEWTGLRVPTPETFLGHFRYARIRPLDSLACGPWIKDRPEDPHVPVAQWFWRAANADRENRIAAVPGRYQELAYELWATTPEGAAAYGGTAEPVTRAEYRDREGAPLVVGEEPRNRGLWVLPGVLRATLAPDDWRIRPIVTAQTDIRERADAGMKIGGARKDLSGGRRARRGARADQETMDGDNETSDHESAAGSDPALPWADWSWLESNDERELRGVAGRMRRDAIWKPPTKTDLKTFQAAGGTAAAWYFRELIRQSVAASPITQVAIKDHWTRRRYWRALYRPENRKGAMVMYPFLVAALRDRVQSWHTMRDVLAGIKPNDRIVNLNDLAQDVVAATKEHAASGASPGLFRQAIQDKTKDLAGNLNTMMSLLAGKKRAISEMATEAMKLLGDPVAGALTALQEPIQESVTNAIQAEIREIIEPALAQADIMLDGDATKMAIGHFATMGWGRASDDLWRLALKIAIAERIVVYADDASAAEINGILLTGEPHRPQTNTDPAEGTGIPRRGVPSPRFTNLKREGPARRVGSITEEILLKTFGLRGIEYGNRVTAADRQAMLDGAYDGFFDMAQALGVPTEFMGFYGRLGLALGARGRGGSAAAHYESDREVINLTKTLGSGMLAHEWAHALDDWLGRREGVTNSADVRFASGTAVQERWYAYANGNTNRQAMGLFMEAIHRRAAGPVGDTESARQSRLAILEKFATTFPDPAETTDPAAAAARTAFRRWMAEEVMPAVATEGHGSTLFLQLFCRPGRSWMFHPEAQVSRIQNWMDSHPDFATQRPDIASLTEAARYIPYSAFRSAWKALGKNASARNRLTDFAIDAEALGAYWSSKHEMFARAFSAVIHDRMAAQGVTNEFASKFSAPTIFLSNHYKGSSNPEGEERVVFAERATPLILAIQNAALEDKPDAKARVAETASIKEPAPLAAAQPGP